MDTQAILSDLARAKAVFQMRGIAAFMEAPAVIRRTSDGMIMSIEALRPVPIKDQEV